MPADPIARGGDGLRTEALADGPNIQGPSTRQPNPLRARKYYVAGPVLRITVMKFQNYCY